MSPTNEDLGQIGENTLAKWAAQVGATANPSVRDVKGWDFILQFAPPDSDRKGPLDRGPPETVCMVQVKTSRSSCRSASIKLSNWQRMVSDPTPWFVLLLALDDRLEPAEAHLVHIDDEWCGAVLKRLRELGDEPADALHKHTLDITCSDRDRLPDLSGHALMERIRTDVAPGQHAYTARKIAWYESLGYDESPRELSMIATVKSPEEFWEGLAELGIGVRETIPGYTGTKVFDQRFGLKGTILTLEQSDGDVKLGPPPPDGSARLRLAAPESGLHVEFPCDLYRAGSTFHFLPDEYDKVRFAAKYISLTMPFNPPTDTRSIESSIQLQFPREEILPFEDLDLFVTTLALLRGPSDLPLELHLQGEVNGNPWKLHFGLSRLALPEQLVKLLEGLQLALAVMGTFDVPADMPVKPDELLAQFESVRFMSAAFEAKGPLQAATQQDVSLGDMYGAPSEVVIYLPSHVLYASIGIYGPISELIELPQGKLLKVAAVRSFAERAIVSNEEAGSFDRKAFRETMDELLKAAGCRFLHPRPRGRGTVDTATPDE